ncbi:MAG: hypothetical protein GY874_13920 [Desulfobacteraceae bacterium]|nr:hypothetical protein [Desulfobacteraceae bacterium]
MIEKRKLTRQCLLYHLRVFDISNYKLIGHVADIHTEGMMVLSEQPQKVDAIHDLRVVLPEVLDGKEDVRFRGIVVWSGLHPNTIFYSSGFRVQHISQVHVEIIKMLIDRYGFKDIFNNAAVGFYRGIEGYNCAQSIMRAYHKLFDYKKDVVEEFAAHGSGNAPGGMCGALYATLRLVNDPIIEKRIISTFMKEVGATLCDEIFALGRLSCAGCIYTASSILQSFLQWQHQY